MLGRDYGKFAHEFANLTPSELAGYIAENRIAHIRFQRRQDGGDRRRRVKEEQEKRKRQKGYFGGNAPRHIANTQPPKGGNDPDGSAG